MIKVEGDRGLDVDYVDVPAGTLVVHSDSE